jgi:hypothetical protein
MTNTTTARVDRTRTYNDLEIARLVHRAMAEVQDAGRSGDRKVFIASLWTRMVTIEAQSGGTLTEERQSRISRRGSSVAGYSRAMAPSTVHG